MKPRPRCVGNHLAICENWFTYQDAFTRNLPTSGGSVIPPAWLLALQRRPGRSGRALLFQTLPTKPPGFQRTHKGVNQPGLPSGCALLTRPLDAVTSCNNIPHKGRAKADATYGLGHFPGRVDAASSQLIPTGASR